MFRVIGTEAFDAEFDRLKVTAEKGNGESRFLVKIIEKGIEKLKFDYKSGSKISKKMIPAEYVEKYGVENLWKLNLNKSWRLIYTVRGDDTEVISILIEALDHKKYDRKFGYKTS